MKRRSMRVVLQSSVVIKDSTEYMLRFRQNIFLDSGVAAMTAEELDKRTTLSLSRYAQ